MLFVIVMCYMNKIQCVFEIDERYFKTNLIQNQEENMNVQIIVEEL